MTKRTRSTALAALALVLGTLLALASPAAAQDEPPPPVPSTLGGTVVRDAVPVAGALVTPELRAEDGSYGPVTGVDPVTTGDDGSFTFSLPAGTYRLSVARECFEPAASGDVTVPPDAADVVVALTPSPASVTAAPAPTSAPTGTSVAFDATPAGGCGAVTYEWDLDGDGAFDDSTEPAPAFAYAVPGDYAARVRTTDTLGTVTDSEPVTVTATNRLPAVGPVTASPAALEAGQAVTFSTTAADPEGRLAAVEWDLDGDGAYDDAVGTTTQRVSFPAGAATVRVRATDRDGGSATAELTLAVSEPPPPTPPPVQLPAPPVVEPPRDTAAPAYTARRLPRQRLTTVRKRGLRFAVRCSEACTAYLEVLVDRRTARRLKIDRRARADVRIGRVTVRLGEAGTETARIKLTRKARTALKTPKRVTLTVQGSAWDAGGYTSLLAPRKLTVKR